MQCSRIIRDASLRLLIAGSEQIRVGHQQGSRSRRGHLVVVIIPCGTGTVALIDVLPAEKRSFNRYWIPGR